MKVIKYRFIQDDISDKHNKHIALSIDFQRESIFCDDMKIIYAQLTQDGKMIWYIKVHHTAIRHQDKPILLVFSKDICLEYDLEIVPDIGISDTDG